MHRHLIVLFGLLVLAVGAADVSALGSSGLAKGAKEVSGSGYVQSIDMLFNVGPGGSLLLGTTLGSIEVQTWSRDEIRVIVTKRTNAVDVEAARRVLDMFSVRALHGGRNLTLKAQAGSRECAESVGVQFTIWVPKSYNLDIKTTKGSITLPEVDGTFSAHTDDGRITLDCDAEAIDIEVEDRSDDEGADTPEPVRGSDASGGHDGQGGSL